MTINRCGHLFRVDFLGIILLLLIFLHRYIPLYPDYSSYFWSFSDFSEIFSIHYLSLTSSGYLFVFILSEVHWDICYNFFFGFPSPISFSNFWRDILKVIIYFMIYLFCSSWSKTGIMGSIFLQCFFSYFLIYFLRWRLLNN